MKSMPLLLLIHAAGAHAVTLVSRSTGLEIPGKEAGNTELEFGDVDGDGHLDLVSEGDHGSPCVGTDPYGIMVWHGDGAASGVLARKEEEEIDVHRYGEGRLPYPTHPLHTAGGTVIDW